jgi:hypothetical protein
MQFPPPRCALLLRCVKHAGRRPGPPEARALWIGGVSEWRRQQGIKIAAFDRDSGLGRLNQALEKRLRRETVGQLP